MQLDLIIKHEKTRFYCEIFLNSRCRSKSQIQPWSKMVPPGWIKNTSAVDLFYSKLKLRHQVFTKC